jgi:hypothetical protein
MLCNNHMHIEKEEDKSVDKVFTLTQRGRYAVTAILAVTA